ncbi:MAG: hypothetical protein ACD_7C00384G0004 [uncultured bacterium]|nr:MAG: hypothetical protein ACD_7C00384G0004 [uncultured bacterium]HBR78827.1 hypothetical protein [Candidatus Moranbacteria bacterium]
MVNDNKISEVLTEKKAEQQVEFKEESKNKCCEDQEEYKCKCTSGHKKIILIIVVVVVVIIALVGYKFKTVNPMALFQHKKVLKVEEAKSAALDFINKNLVQAGTKVDIAGVVAEGSLYKLDLDVAGQKITAYMTNDGSLFFPTGKDMNATTPKAEAPAVEPDKEIAKSVKPVVDLYVMAFCPFGNKAEDTLSPVYDLLKNKVTFNFHYIVSTNGDEIQSLHGAKEVTENEKEACVLKNYGKDKWMDIVTYVNTNCGNDGVCFETGAKSLGIDGAKVNSCVSSNGVALMKENEKSSTEAGASGSPTMIINGVSTSKVYQYGNSEAYKQIICSAFETAPAECEKVLATTTTTTEGGSCGN